MSERRNKLWESICRFAPTEDILEELRDSEIDLLYLRYVEGLTLKEVGERFGTTKNGNFVTPERARQLINVALAALRRAWQRRWLNDEDMFPANSTEEVKSP